MAGVEIIAGIVSAELASVVRPGATAGQPLSSLSVDLIFCGLTEPGRRFVGHIDDKDGRMLGDRQVLADAGGNWRMAFQSVDWSSGIRIGRKFW